MNTMKFLVLFLGISNICFADVNTNKYLACFVKASQYYKVPQEILQAIAYVESNYNPNAYNENSNHTYDIGLMQINSTWLPRLKLLNITEDMLYDPCQSIYVGGWILATNIKVYGLNWNAVQHYNGSDVELKYATKVYDRIEQTYPELLNQSKAKLIPVAQKTHETVVIEKQLAYHLAVNSQPDILAKNASDVAPQKAGDGSNDEQEVDAILRQSGIKLAVKQESAPKAISTKDEQNIDNLLLKSGVKIATRSPKPAVKLEPFKPISTVSFNQFFTQNQPKNLNAFLQNVLSSNKKIVAIKPVIQAKVLQNYTTSFVMNLDGICDKNINALCNFYPSSLLEISTDLLPNIELTIKETPYLSKKIRKVSNKNYHKNRAEMLVI